MSVRPIKRAKGTSWMVDIKFPAGRVRRAYPSRALAEKVDRLISDRLDRGLPFRDVLDGEEPEAMTMEKLLALTIDAKWKGTKSERSSVLNAKHAVLVLGAGRHPNTITAHDIEDYILACSRAGNTGSTINRKVSTLSVMLKHAHRLGFISSMPYIARKSENPGRLRWYSREEEQVVLNYLDRSKMTSARHRDFRDIFIFLLDSGARLGEAMKLQWRDYYEGKVTFHDTKSGKSRTIPASERIKDMMDARIVNMSCKAGGGRLKAIDLSPGLVPSETLQAIRRHPEASEALVFAGWDGSKAYNCWLTIRAAVGILDKGANLHALRHTCASRFAASGVPVHDIKEWMGHSTLAVTEKYMHLAPTALTSLVEVVDAGNSPGSNVVARIGG